MYLFAYSELAFVLILTDFSSSRFYFSSLFEKRIFISQRFNFFTLTLAKDATVLSSKYCLSCWVL